ncbi:MAG: hypothetical protein ABSH09_02145 [Bryobacteraceae bacterium]|jgi:hypothetical protein
MALDSAIISVATGLLKAGNSPVLDFLIAAIFAFGLSAALVGVAAINKGHQYYRRTVVRKTLLEDLLGLTKPVLGYPIRHTLSIGSTAGQNEHMEVLHDTTKWLERPSRRGSVTFWITTLLKLLAVVNIVGIIVALWLGVSTSMGPPAETPRFIAIATCGGAPVNICPSVRF